ncbi:YhcN/YlaJ family sporulation lipoprotein [Tumebacillus flagellatus]|uniref:Sporulation protein n=1 Tax=Tumebacillus flagellatus TaxID=1157490 RepID=A0A074LPP2_9BACL|nr:YhcN/YlaJ family sporulation lipoprotein [Tumebacillus flagellatus]KEO83049.1 hypothetical protein EL26_12230 [Tumebacillus flagellatus]
MALLRKTGMALTALTLAVGLTGCGNHANLGARVNNLDQPSARDASRTNVQSAGVQVRQDIGRKLDTINGVRNSTVLVQGGNAYVGMINIGKEHQMDAAMKSGDNWNDMPYGTQQNPKSAAGMTVQQMQAEGLDPAHTHDGPYSTMSGNIDDATKKKVDAIVRANVKGVRNVYLTGNVDHVQKLSGYKHYISRGGNMKAHLQEFNQFIRQSFGTSTPEQQNQQLQNNARISPSQPRYP